MPNNIGYQLWLETVRKIPTWEWTTGILTLCGTIFLFSLYQLFSLYRLDIFHAFEKIKIKNKDLDKEFPKTLYFEITIPKDSQTTAFQIQQKILKAFHSVYQDPIEGPHQFSRYFYFFQKLYRHWKVALAKQVFFTMQVWAQYPYISFRLQIPIAFFQRMEKAIFNAYPNAEITMLDKDAVLAEVAKYQKSYLSYGQTTIEGKFYHRVKTFKDVSSDPVDSVISTMEALAKGRFMAYNILISPSSHYFNQIIHYLIEDQERAQQEVAQAAKQTPSYKKEPVSDLASSLKIAMEEKMKASLFQTIISYWAVSETPEDAEIKLANIQGVLTEVNQKNMNMLKHKRLFTRQVEDLATSGQLRQIIDTKPVLRTRKLWLWPFSGYQNFGQVISDIELFSLWHLPDTNDQTVSSVKTVKFKKKPASQQMREYDDSFYVELGKSNFRMQEDTKIGIPTWDDMKKHVYILGGTGSGKSETLKTILSHVLQKTGKDKAACLVIDPKNDFATDLLTMIPEERKADVVYFNPSKQQDKPLSFPFFSQFSGDKSDEERLGFLISIMKRFVQIDSANSWGPELENILRQLFTTAYVLPAQSLSGLDQLLHEPNQIKNLLKYLPLRLQSFWTDSILKRSNNDLARYLATTNNKIGKFLDYQEFMNIADRLETKITFEDMIKQGKIFIANFGSSSEQLKKYYSVYLSAHIAEAIFGQARLNSEDRKPCVFVIDEFQRVASDIFETLFSEVRAFNTALVISNQFMGQLDERIQKSIESNIATKIFMRTQSVGDSEIAEKILGGRITVEDIINLPTGTAYLKTLVQGVPQDAMSINIQKTPHPKDILRDTEEYFIKETMESYGTPLEVIKQKRDNINGIYYSAKREQIFRELMGRHTTFEPDKERAPAAVNF
ncbi:MAG: ATP-binding protein [Patescibacteria group bacterium]|nr:ATP-binding protein [Patescibacteria group bacterium]